MHPPDSAISAALKRSRHPYILLRVGSSLSPSVEVESSDLDYLCINPSIPDVLHSEQIERMVAFSDSPKTVGFEPIWTKEDASMPNVISESLGSAYRCFFRFGPLAHVEGDENAQVIHFAGPVSGGDFKKFSSLFPVLSYIFLRYNLCLLGDINALLKELPQPRIEDFSKLVLANCERGRQATETRWLVKAAQKVLLLREIWQDRLDPYHHSRCEAKAWHGVELRLLSIAANDPVLFLRNSTGPAL